MFMKKKKLILIGIIMMTGALLFLSINKYLLNSKNKQPNDSQNQPVIKANDNDTTEETTTNTKEDDKIKTINFNLGVNLETVPIIGQMTLEGYDCDTLLQDAEGYSEIDRLPREGLVFRDLAGKESFKAVSNSFLEKYHS